MRLRPKSELLEETQSGEPGEMLCGNGEYRVKNPEIIQVNSSYDRKQSS